MRVSAVLSTNYRNCTVRNNKALKQQAPVETIKDELAFKGKGKVVGGVVGGAAGAAGGAAIMGVELF